MSSKYEEYLKRKPELEAGVELLTGLVIPRTHKRPTKWGVWKFSRETPGPLFALTDADAGKMRRGLIDGPCIDAVLEALDVLTPQIMSIAASIQQKKLDTLQSAAAVEAAEFLDSLGLSATPPDSYLPELDHADIHAPTAPDESDESDTQPIELRGADDLPPAAPPLAGCTEADVDRDNLPF